MSELTDLFMQKMLSERTSVTASCSFNSTSVFLEEIKKIEIFKNELQKLMQKHGVTTTKKSVDFVTGALEDTVILGAKNAIQEIEGREFPVTLIEIGFKDYVKPTHSTNQ